MVPKKNRKKELTRLPGKTVQDRALKELNGFVQDYNKLGSSLGIPEELLLGGMKPEQVWLGRGGLLNPISGLDPVKDSPKFEPGVTIGDSTEDARDRRAARFSTMKEDSEGNLLNPIPGLVDGGKLWGWISGQRLTDAYGAKQVNDYLIGGWTRDEKPTVHPKLYETQTEYYEDMDPEGKKERYPSGKWHKAVVPGPDLWGPAAMQRRANHDRRVLESARK